MDGSAHAVSAFKVYLGTILLIASVPLLCAQELPVLPDARLLRPIPTPGISAPVPIVTDASLSGNFSIPVLTQEQLRHFRQEDQQLQLQQQQQQQQQQKQQQQNQFQQQQEIEPQELQKHPFSQQQNIQEQEQRLIEEQQQVPELPLTVGFDPFLEQPKPGFFGKMKKWFSHNRKSASNPNVGKLRDNQPGAHNSFGRNGAAWGRSTVYYPPLQYSSHLIPVSSGAFDLKSYDFRPYRPGHPRITRRRFVTRIILRRRDPPLRRNQIERDQIDEERNTERDHLSFDKELRTEREYYERNKAPSDPTDPEEAVPDPRLEEQHGFRPSQLYQRPMPQLDFASRLSGYPE